MAFTVYNKYLLYKSSLLPRSKVTIAFPHSIMSVQIKGRHWGGSD